MFRKLLRFPHSNRLIARLGGIIKRNPFQDVVILLILNLVLAFNYLLSASDKIPGFRYRMDGYSYPLFANLLGDLIHQHIVPLGDVWVRQVGAGYTFFIVPDPLFASYSLILATTGDFILTYKILLFLLYLSSGITCYYLASILLMNRGPRLVTTVSYTFSQTTLYEVSLGHLSMVYGMALLPAIIALLLKAYRESRVTLSVLSGFLLFFLIVEREDYGYMMLTFIALLMIYHLIFRKGSQRSVIASTFLTISIALTFSFPYLQTAILSKLSLWEQAGVNYAAYSPTLLQLFVPIFSNVEAYLGDITIFLAIICVYGLTRRKTGASLRYESRFFYMLSVIALLFTILGMGSATPIYGALYAYLPTFTGFRAVAGNPTYWLQPSKLCLGLLCGAGAGILARRPFNLKWLKLKVPRRTLLVILILALVLDGATFLARNEPYSPIPGWNPILSGIWTYNAYQFVQTASVPDGASAYRYISADPGSYNVLEIPFVYTLPDYQYLNYLSKTNITMLNPYGVPKVPSIFSEIYSSGTALSASTGNATILASDLALIGVKYVVYQAAWGGPFYAQGLSQPTTPFQLVMQDGNASLFRNLLYGANFQLPNRVRDPGFEDFNSTGWQPWNVSDNVQCMVACLDNRTAHTGTVSLREVASGPSIIAGRNQFINASYFPSGKYGVSGWNRAMNVSAGAEYGIRILATYQNGTEVTIAYTPFQVGTHDWQYSQTFFDIENSDQLKQLAISTYLRSGAGQAWVDDINLHEQVALSNSTGVFAVRSLYPKSSETIAQENLVQSTSTSKRLDRFHLEVDLQLGEPAFIILPMSFDSGWIVTSATSGSLRPTSYEGLTVLYLAGGSYQLLFFYSSHQSSLDETLLVYSLGIFEAAAVILGNFLLRRELFEELRKGISRRRTP